MLEERGVKIMSSKIHTNDAPAAIGPYSQAVTVGNLVFTSGQIPLDPVTGEMVGKDIAEQAQKNRGKSLGNCGLF